MPQLKKIISLIFCVLFKLKKVIDKGLNTFECFEHSIFFFKYKLYQFFNIINYEQVNCNLSSTFFLNFMFIVHWFKSSCNSKHLYPKAQLYVFI